MRRAGVLVAVVLLVLVSACTTRVGAPTGEMKWREDADKVLGAAMSSLGTARVVLENRADLPHPYAVVTLHDTVAGLQKESGSFLSSQPPDDLHAENQAVVAALGEATTVLTQVSTALASPGIDDTSAKPLLRGVKEAYDALDELRTKVSGS